jgi:hypothetical protein
MENFYHVCDSTTTLSSDHERQKKYTVASIDERIQKQTELVEKECLDRKCFEWVEVEELKEIGFSEIILDQLFQPKTVHSNIFNAQIPSYCSTGANFNNKLYGELITLGYRSYQVSSNQDLIPVGTANDKFSLRFKSFQEPNSSQSTIIIKPNMIFANQNYYPAIGVNEV